MRDLFTLWNKWHFNLGQSLGPIGMILVAAVIVPGMSGCANKEITELQNSVGALQNQLQATDQETTEISRTVEDRLTTLSNQQRQLNELLTQLSDRFSEMEMQVDRLQDRIAQVESFSSQSANLAQDLSQQNLTLEQQFAQRIEQLNRQVQELTDEVNSLQTTSQTRYQDAISRTQQVEQSLNQRITTIENNNRKVYERILNELGASVPDDVQATQPAASSGSGVHIVERGDTLSAIASQYGVSLDALQQLNDISDPSQIRIGQRIAIPQ